jgi:hypothetical protein
MAARQYCRLTGFSHAVSVAGFGVSIRTLAERRGGSTHVLACRKPA